MTTIKVTEDVLDNVISGVHARNFFFDVIGRLNLTKLRRPQINISALRGDVTVTFKGQCSTGISSVNVIGTIE